MNTKGQILEILSTSSIYGDDKVLNLSKEEDFLSVSQMRKYSLFDGVLIGEHLGLNNYKLGQRKAITKGGKQKPLYVIAKDEIENRLIVGEGNNHRGLFTKVLAYNKKLVNKRLLQLKNNTILEIKSEKLEKSLKASFFMFETYLFLKFEHQIEISLINKDLFLIHKQDTMMIGINH